MGLILLVLVSIILTACTYRWYKQNGVLRKLHWIPKVPGLPVLGNIWDFGKTTDFLNVISRYCEKYNGLCWIDLVRTKNIIISDYKVLEVVLSNMSILNKPREYSFFHSWLGSGLLTAGSEKWKKTRKMLTPAFHFSILEQFVEIFESNGRILVDLLEKETDKSYVNVYPFLTLATLDIICESAMGVSINAQKNSQSDYVRATKEMCRIVAERPFSAVKMFHTLYPLSKDYYKEQRCLKILHTQSESVIKERRELKNKKKAKAVKEEVIGAKKKMAFLDMLLEARINGEPLTDREIRDEVETFMFEIASLIRDLSVRMSVVLGIIIAIIVAALCYRWYRIETIKQKLDWVSHVPGWPVIGNALEVVGVTELLGNVTRVFKQHGKLVFLDFVGKPNIFTTDYDFIEFVLGTHSILNKSIDYRFIRNWLGTGLLTSDGPKWKGRRRIATPGFHFSILEQFVEIFEKNGKILVKKLNKEVGKDSFDIYPYITLCALDIICETAMGVSVDAQINENSQYVKNVKQMCKIGIIRSTSIFKNHDLLYPFSMDYFREQKAVKELHDVTNTVIDSRREKLQNSANKMDTEDDLGRKKKLAFLDILLQSTVDGKPLSREDIREEVDTFMFEGHDTTASAMTFASFLIAGHPEVQERALEEQKAIFGDDFLRPATYKDLLEMKYLECVIKESLRLYPSVPMYGRHTHEDVYYKGNLIPKDVDIIIFNYGVLHDPDNYPDPEKFDPSRFERVDGKRPFIYIPFSAGPRNCIGQKFAMLEMKCTLSKLLRNYELCPAEPKHTLILAPEAVLKSANGVRVKVKARKNIL